MISANELIGYDLDGTLCSPTPPRGKSFFKQNGAERRAYEALKQKHYLSAELKMFPMGRFVVISGRALKWYPETVNWLEAHGLYPDAVHLYPGKRVREAMIRFKADTCKLLGVTLYYEDDPLIVTALRAEGITVVQVCNGQEVRVGNPQG